MNRRRGYSRRPKRRVTWGVEDGTITISAGDKIGINYFSLAGIEQETVLVRTRGEILTYCPQNSAFAMMVVPASANLAGIDPFTPTTGDDYFVYQSMCGLPSRDTGEGLRVIDSKAKRRVEHGSKIAVIWALSVADSADVYLDWNIRHLMQFN